MNILAFGVGILMLIIALMITLNLKNVIEDKKQANKTFILMDVVLGSLLIGIALTI